MVTIISVHVLSKHHPLKLIVALHVFRKLSSFFNLLNSVMAAMRVRQVFRCLQLLFNVYMLYPIVVVPSIIGQLGVFAAEASESYFLCNFARTIIVTSDMCG